MRKGIHLVGKKHSRNEYFSLIQKLLFYDFLYGEVEVVNKDLDFSPF